MDVTQYVLLLCIINSYGLVFGIQDVSQGSTLYIHGENLFWNKISISVQSKPCNIVPTESYHGNFIACKIPGGLEPGVWPVTISQTMITSNFKLKQPALNIRVKETQDKEHTRIKFSSSAKRRQLEDGTSVLDTIGGESIHFISSKPLPTDGKLMVIIGSLLGNIEKNGFIKIPYTLPAGTHEFKLVHDVANSEDVSTSPLGVLETNIDLIRIIPTVSDISQQQVKENIDEIILYGTGFNPQSYKSNLIDTNEYDQCNIFFVDYHIIKALCSRKDLKNDQHNHHHHSFHLDIFQIPMNLPEKCLQKEQGILKYFQLGGECELGEKSKFERLFITGDFNFPNRHPTLDNTPKLKSYLAISNKHDFVAPFTGLYEFEVRCTGAEKNICGLNVNQENNEGTVKIVQLNQDDRIPFSIYFLHLTSNEQVKLEVYVKITLEDQIIFNSLVPTDWLSLRTTIPTIQSATIRVIVNGITSICRNKNQEYCSPHRISGSVIPNYDAYPAHVLDETLSTPVNDIQHNLRTLQGTNAVPWSSYASSCGQVCVIPIGVKILLDVNMDVFSLTVLGDLIWDTTRSGLTLSSGFVVVEGSGAFILGTQANPMMNTATLYLKDNGATHSVVGKRVFGGVFTDGITGPNVQVHGKPLKKTWSLLIANAVVGDRQIQIADTSTGWSIGDRIAIAPTILPATSQQGTGYAEVFTITNIVGNLISLSSSVTQKYLGVASRRLQAEVINLSRNVIITGDSFDANLHGLHTILAGKGLIKITYTRIEKGGQRGLKGKYPLHAHLVESCPECLFLGNAIEDSNQRGIIVHGTHNMLIQENVLFKIRGAGLYVEDGNELFNTFQDNVNICEDSSRERMGCRASGTDNEQADFTQQSGLWALSVTNNFIGNRLVNHYNAFFTQTSAFTNGRGFAQGKVCTVHAPFGKFSRNVCHSNWRFGFYLDNSMPRQLSRSLSSNGYVTDIAKWRSAEFSSCDEFKPDGTDNGQVGIVEDQLDFFSDFVGVYELGDIQLLRYTGINNLKSWYWKQTKPFQDGVSSHIKDSVFVWYSDLNLPGMPGEGVALMQGPGGLGAFIIENTKFSGAVTEGGICMNQHCGVGPGTGSLCTPEYTLINVDFKGMASGRKWFKFGVSDGNPELPMITTLDTNAESLSGFRSVASSAQSHLLTHPNSICQTSQSVGKQVEFDGGIICHGRTRRLNIWSSNQGGLTLQSPGGGSYLMKYQPSSCDGCNAPNERKSGYGAVVLDGFSYSIPSLDWNYHPRKYSPYVTLEFSDIIFGDRFNQPNQIQLQINGLTCLDGVSSQHDRLFVGTEGPMQDKHGACREKTTSSTPTISTSTQPPTGAKTQTPFTITKIPTSIPTIRTNSPFTNIPTSKTTIPTNIPTIRTNSPFTSIPTSKTNIPTIRTNSPFTSIPTSKTNIPTIRTNSPFTVTKTPTIRTNSPFTITKTPTIRTNSPVLLSKTPTIRTNSPTIITKTPSSSRPTPFPSTLRPSSKFPTGIPSKTPTKTSKSPTKTPSTTCTGENGDPWGTGINIPCCCGLQPCLRDWKTNGNWFYKCVSPCLCPA